MTKRMCLSCGPTNDILARGLCGTCYGRAWNQGIHTNYPACGAVPVPKQPSNRSYAPWPGSSVPPASVNLDTLLPADAPRWLGAWSQKKWCDTVDYEQRRVREWFASHRTVAD